MIDSKTLEKFTAGYIAALLWSSAVQSPDGEDANADEFEISTAAADRCRADCLHFCTRNADAVSEASQLYGADHAGHDFALTRNGHGAGYWDGDLPAALGEVLSAAAQAAGPCEVYLGDDGLVYTL